MNTTDKKVIVLSGVSGSGKTTWARAQRDSVIVSADHFFITTDAWGKERYEFNPAKLSEAHAFCFRKFLEALVDGKPLVIVDNTNTTSEEIAPYMLGAAAYGYEAEILTIEVAFDAFDNDGLVKAANRNTHGVSVETVGAQHERLRKRRLPPWWKSSVIRGEF